METIDLRRVVELHFHRTLGQMCLNRGTVGADLHLDLAGQTSAVLDVTCEHQCTLCGAQIVICSDNAEFPELRLTTFGTKKIFEQLRGVRGCGTLSMTITLFGVRIAGAHKVADPEADDMQCRHGRKPALPQLSGSMTTTTACDTSCVKSL